MRFKVVQGEDFFDSNPEALAIKEFSKATSRHMKYVCLAYDYDSPLASIPLKQRKIEAALQAGYKRDARPGYNSLDGAATRAVNGDVKAIQSAIKKFLEIQYDLEKETLKALEAQLAEFIEFAKKKGKDEKQLALAEKLMDKMPTRLKQLKQLKQSVGEREIEIDEVKDVKEEDVSAQDKYNENLGY